MKLFNKKYVYLEWDDKLKDKDCILATTYKDLKDFVNSGDEGRICKVEKGKEKPFTNHWRECDFCYFDPNREVKKALLRNEKVQYYSSFGKWEDLNLWESAEDYLDSEDWDRYEWRIEPTDEQYFVCLYDGDSFLRISNIVNLNNTKFFSGTYEECRKWIDNHKSCEKICKAKLEGKSIEYRAKSASSNAKWYIATCPLKDYDFDYYNYRVKPKESTHRMTNRELTKWIAEGNGEVRNITDNCTSIIFAYDFERGDKEVIEDIRIRKWDSDEWEEPLVRE